MAEVTQWAGLIKDILNDVATLIDDNKGTLSNGSGGTIQEVFRSEQRGWQSPAAFVFLGPSGAQVERRSNRHGVNDVAVPVRVVIEDRQGTDESADLEVITLLEGILDLMEANPQMGSAHNFEVESPARIVAGQEERGGPYITVGDLDVFYLVQIDRGHV